MSPIPKHNTGGPKAALSRLKDLSGGLNIKANRFNIPLNQMVQLQNFALFEDGSLIGRRGSTQLNTTSLGTQAPLGVQRYYAGTNLFLVDYAGTIYQSTNGTAFTSSKTGFSVSKSMWFWQYLKYTYVATTVDAPQKFDGTTWSAMGIAAPSTAPTAAAGAAGSLSGTYRFYVAFKTATIESNTGPVSSPDLSLTNQQANLTAIATGPTGTTARTIYGFKVGVSSTPQLIGTISDNTTTTLTVTTDQSSWTVTNQTTNNPPVTGAWLTVLFKNRLWKAGDPNNPQRLYFSQILLPEGWPTAFYVDIPFLQNDSITALFVLGDLLLVYGNNQLFYVIGDTPFSFIVKQSYSQAGAVSPWAVDRVENTAVFLSRYGVYAFDGALTILLSGNIDPAFTGVLPQFTAMNYANSANATLVYYDRLKALCVSYSTVGPGNDTTYWYFFQRKAWTQDSRKASFLQVNSGSGDTGNLYAWDAANGILYQWDTGYTDLGAAITATFETGSIDFDSPKTTKQMGWLTVRAQPGNYNLSITGLLDQGRKSDSFALSLATGAAYGTATYGTSTYAPDIDNFEQRFSGVMVGRSLQLQGSIVYSAFCRIAEIMVEAQDFQTVRPNA